MVAEGVAVSVVLTSFAPGAASAATSVSGVAPEGNVATMAVARVAGRASRGNTAATDIAKRIAMGFPGRAAVRR